MACNEGMNSSVVGGKMVGAGQMSCDPLAAAAPCHWKPRPQLQPPNESFIWEKTTLDFSQKLLVSLVHLFVYQSRRVRLRNRKHKLNFLNHGKLPASHETYGRRFYFPTKRQWRAGTFKCRHSGQVAASIISRILFTSCYSDLTKALNRLVPASKLKP